MWWKYPITRGKTVFVRCFLFQHSVMTNPTIFWTLLRSNAYGFVQDFVLFLWGKSRDIVYQRICLFLLLIFAQHWLFEIQLTVYSALSRLTDLGIYDVTRCGIWLLTIFHIPYIHLQRELRNVTSPKWYLSFFVQYTKINQSYVSRAFLFFEYLVQFWGNICQSLCRDCSSNGMVFFINLQTF